MANIEYFESTAVWLQERRFRDVVVAYNLSSPASAGFVLTLVYRHSPTVSASCFCRGGEEEGAARRVSGAPQERETSTPSGGLSRNKVAARSRAFVQQ